MTKAIFCVLLCSESLYKEPYKLFIQIASCICLGMQRGKRPRIAYVRNVFYCHAWLDDSSSCTFLSQKKCLLIQWAGSKVSSTLKFPERSFSVLQTKQRLRLQTYTKARMLILEPSEAFDVTTLFSGIVPKFKTIALCLLDHSCSHFYCLENDQSFQTLQPGP